MAPQDLEVQEKKELATEEKTDAGTYYLPYTDIHESPDHLIVTMDVPGVKKDDVDIEVEQDVLTVTGRVDYSNYEGLAPVYTEYNVGNYTRKFAIGKQIDTSAISAKIEDGILTVTLPKAKEAVAKRITVQ